MTLEQRLQEIINNEVPVEESIRNSAIRRAIREIKVQRYVIGSLYDALGPAVDDIMDDAYKYAEQRVEQESHD